MSKSRRLRDLIEGDAIAFGPGIYDCIGARLAEKAGFPVIFSSGYGIAASRFGLPDLGLLSATEMLAAAASIADSVDIPLIADMDTGYGNALNVTRTVRDAVKAGVAGIILEDQEWPKRCGHMEGKRVVPAAEHAARIRAAAEARGKGGLVLVARTDARAVRGLDDAIARGRLYVEAGADVVFVEAPQSEAELRAIATALPDVPLFANMIEGGKTPTLPRAELERLGYRLGVFALSGLFATTGAVRRCFEHLAETGTTEGLDLGLDFNGFEEVVDTPGWRALDKRFSPDEG